MTSYTFSQLIDFTRTTSGTFVGSNGLIQTTPASTNLLTFTQEFDNAAWAKLNGLTVTANSAVAPDSTSTADTLVEPAATSIFAIRQGAVFAAGSGTFSIYVKPNGRNWIELVVASGGSGSAFFNVATGTVGTTSGATATITAAGNGWYRCAIVFTATAGSNFLDLRLASADGTTSYTGNGTSGVFVWGAQLEQASAATTYTRNYGGLYPPRFDYDPVTLAPKGLLIEEQRTNLLTYSEQFDNAAWTKNDCAVTANATTSPDGTVTADTVTANAGTAFHYVRRTSALTPTGAHTYTFYVKKNTASWVFFTVNDSGINYFNLDTGLFGTTPDTCSASVAGNGWYRISVTRTLSATAANCGIGVANGDGGASFNAAGTESVYIWGAQLEAGAFATSYIPTVASQVTRTADQAVIQAPMFAPWYNQSEGTFVANVQRINSAALSWAGELLGAGGNSMRIRLGTDARIQSIDAGVVQVDTQIQSPALAIPSKYAMAYALNDYAGSADGGAVATDTSGTVPVVSSLVLGSTSVTNLYLRSIRYYPVRLSNAQLQALTA